MRKPPKPPSRLFSPPQASDKMKGRALTAKEVRYLLSGPDRSKPKGARDYALMLVMLRLGLRVSEVCSLKASPIHWSHGRWTVRLKVKGQGADAAVGGEAGDRRVPAAGVRVAP